MAESTAPASKRPPLSDAIIGGCLSIASGATTDERLRAPFTIPVYVAGSTGSPVGTLVSLDTVRVSREWANKDGGVVRGGFSVAVLPDTVKVAADTGWYVLSDIAGIKDGYKLHVCRIAQNSGNASDAYGQYAANVKDAGLHMEPPTVSKRAAPDTAAIKAAAASEAVATERARCIASLTAAGMKGPQLAATLKALGYDS